ncbi:MAG TPA: response regulator [Longimicrobiales bacterium]|nr:response regulator [Longimicrobiales bacterium]
MTETQATILVIDDDPALRELLRKTLEHDGHRVITAADGAEGLDVYRSVACDIVVTDLFMPGKDGIETIQELRMEFPEARIIAMSGGASTGDMGSLMDARLLGADLALPKPFTMASMSRAVESLLDGGA